MAAVVADTSREVSCGCFRSFLVRLHALFVSLCCTWCSLAREKEKEDGGGSMMHGETLSPQCGSLEQQKRMAMLLGHSTLPTREGLKNVLYSKDIVSLADESCQQLLALVESEFPPLKLCSLCQPLLEKIAANSSLEPYVTPLKRVIFHKLIFQLSRVYATLSIKHFTTHICTSSFLPWAEAEKLFVALVQQQQQQQAALHAQQALAGGGAGGVGGGGAAAAAAAAAGAAAAGHLITGGAAGGLCIRLDYATSAILFETPEAAAANGLRHQLSNLAKHIDKALHMIAPGQSPEERLEKKLFLSELPARLEAETKRMAERTRVTHSRRLEKQEEQQRVEEERRRREAEQRRVEEKQERDRREEATRRREERRMQQEKIKQRSETAAQMLEEIKKLGGKASSSILIKGKQLGDINIDDVLQGNVDYDDLERAQLMQLNKEKLARQRQRRQNYRRVCHFIRACREEELPLLQRWQEETLAHDTQILLDMQNRHDEEHKAAFEAALEEKQVFEVMSEDKELWVAPRLKERQAEFELQAQQQRERLIEQLKQQKIQRARVRKEEHLKKLKLEAERKRMEEEQKKYLEQMEKKRQEEEAKTRRLAEQAERQMQRELEVEEKQRQLDRELLGGGGGRQGGGGGSVPAALPRSGGGETAAATAAPPAAAAAGAAAGAGGALPEEDDWRRGPAATAPAAAAADGPSSSKGIRRERLPARSGGGGGGAAAAGGGAAEDSYERWRSSGPAASPSGAGKLEGAGSGGARPRVRLAAAAAALSAAVGEGTAAGGGGGGGGRSLSNSQPARVQQQHNGYSAAATAGAPAVAAGGGEAATHDEDDFTTVTYNSKRT